MKQQLALLLLLSSLAAPVSARPQGDVGLDDEAVTNLHNFATCLADRRPELAHDLLTRRRGTPEYRTLAGDLSHGDRSCGYIGRLRFDIMLLTGGVAERMVTERTTEAAFATRLAYDPAKPPVHAQDQAELVGMCVVRADPAQTWAVFETVPASRREADAMAAVTPSLSGCVPNGARVSLNRPALRATLAISAYHLINGSAPAPSRGG